MNVLITGGTGLVGSHLIDALLEDYEDIYVLTRGETNSDYPFIHYIQYDPDDEDTSWMKEIPSHIDTVYNFAGASIQEKWTDSHKEAIYDSRMQTTKRLIEWISEAKIKPKVLVNASAIGYYPISKSLEYTEADTFAPHDFLSKVVHAWESTAKHAEEYGVRVICARFGLILDDEAGALPMMATPYKLGLGGKVGSGEQWYSWIHIEDLVNALLYVAAHDSMSGPVNMTAPEPLRQKDFSNYLSSALSRPNVLKAPGFLLKTVFGEMSTLILDGQKVIPKKLMDSEFKFIYPTLEVALNDLFNDSENE